MDGTDTRQPQPLFHTERIIKDDGRYLIYYWFDSSLGADAAQAKRAERRKSEHGEDQAPPRTPLNE